MKSLHETIVGALANELIKTNNYNRLSYNLIMCVIIFLQSDETQIFEENERKEKSRLSKLSPCYRSDFIPRVFQGPKQTETQSDCKFSFILLK
jgi:hypothetical protein